jgi:hypothetical protein
MTESTTYEVWIDMTMKTTIEMEGHASANEAMQQAIDLMPPHVFDALERHGYRIKTIETDASVFNPMGIG